MIIRGKLTVVLEPYFTEYDPRDCCGFGGSTMFGCGQGDVFGFMYGEGYGHGDYGCLDGECAGFGELDDVVEVNNVAR